MCIPSQNAAELTRAAETYLARAQAELRTTNPGRFATAGFWEAKAAAFLETAEAWKLLAR